MIGCGEMNLPPQRAHQQGRLPLPRRLLLLLQVMDGMDGINSFFIFIFIFFLLFVIIIVGRDGVQTNTLCTLQLLYQLLTRANAT